MIDLLEPIIETNKISNFATNILKENLIINFLNDIWQIRSNFTANIITRNNNFALVINQDQQLFVVQLINLDNDTNKLNFNEVKDKIIAPKLNLTNKQNKNLDREFIISPKAQKAKIINFSKLPENYKKFIKQNFPLLNNCKNYLDNQPNNFNNRITKINDIITLNKNSQIVTAKIIEKNIFNIPKTYFTKDVKTLINKIKINAQIKIEINPNISNLSNKNILSSTNKLNETKNLFLIDDNLYVNAKLQQKDNKEVKIILPFGTAITKSKNLIDSKHIFDPKQTYILKLILIKQQDHENSDEQKEINIPLNNKIHIDKTIYTPKSEKLIPPNKSYNSSIIDKLFKLIKLITENIENDEQIKNNNLIKEDPTIKEHEKNTIKENSNWYNLQTIFKISEQEQIIDVFYKKHKKHEGNSKRIIINLESNIIGKSQIDILHLDNSIKRMDIKFISTKFLPSFFKKEVRAIYNTILELYNINGKIAFKKTNSLPINHIENTRFHKKITY